MAEQTLIQFRADKELKKEVSEIYEALGLDLPTAFRMFMAKSKMVKGLPFEATLSEKRLTKTEMIGAFEDIREQAKSLPEMTPEEINYEIYLARKERL